MSISYSVFCLGFFFFFCASENFCVSILLKYIHHYYDAGQSESRFQFFDPGEAKLTLSIFNYWGVFRLQGLRFDRCIFIIGWPNSVLL